LFTASIYGPSRAAQQYRRDRAVLRCEAPARVDDEDDDVGFGDRRLCLARHRGVDARSRRLETTGVDDNVVAIA
jgi:hypothetical protein